MTTSVFFVHKGNPDSERWMRQFPGGVPRIGGCEFVFERPRSSYDWVVVYEDLPSLESDRHPTSSSTFDCDQKNTVLVTTEPASIKVYGKKYLDQFGVVLTSQEPTYISGSNVVHSQCGLQWYVGLDSKPMITWDELAARKPEGARGTISTVCSAKKSSRTFHTRRIELTREFMQAFPEADWYGRGVRPIDEKANALFPYQYHLCIENHLAKHHWTEKLADAFLGWTMPLYVGCTNASDYFDPASFFQFGPTTTASDFEAVREKIQSGAFEDSFEAIQQSRNLVLRDYNLFSVLADIIQSRSTTGSHSSGHSAELLSRREIRKKFPIHGALELATKFTRQFR